MTLKLVCGEGPPILTIPLREPIIMKPDSTVQEAAKAMEENDANIVVIPIEKGYGIVSERDIIVKVVSRGRDPSQVKLEEIMNTDPVMAKPTWTVVLALQLIAATRVRSLPVVGDDGSLRGILDVRDLLRVVIEDVDTCELYAVA